MPVAEGEARAVLLGTSQGDSQPASASLLVAFWVRCNRSRVALRFPADRAQAG